MRVGLLGMLLTLTAVSCSDATATPWAPTTTATGCTKASECGDADPCTKDTCSAGICLHEQRKGCNALTIGVR